MEEGNSDEVQDWDEEGRERVLANVEGCGEE